MSKNEILKKLLEKKITQLTTYVGKFSTRCFANFITLCSVICDNFTVK
uniref:Uncharacterized protein n=1 Tax=viral metagenome TaxID=1070528 RepID=A0A6C0EVH7_9ZZZZ